VAEPPAQQSVAGPEQAQPVAEPPAQQSVAGYLVG